MQLRLTLSVRDTYVFCALFAHEYMSEFHRRICLSSSWSCNMCLLLCALIISQVTCVHGKAVYTADMMRPIYVFKLKISAILISQENPRQWHAQAVQGSARLSSQGNAYHCYARAATYTTHAWRIREADSKRLLGTYVGEEATIEMTPAAACLVHKGFSSGYKLSRRKEPAHWGTFRQRGEACGIPIRVRIQSIFSSRGSLLPKAFI